MIKKTSGDYSIALFSSIYNITKRRLSREHIKNFTSKKKDKRSSIFTSVWTSLMKLNGNC